MEFECACVRARYHRPMSERTPLPLSGAPWPALEAEMRALAARDVKWRDGKAAVYVFHAGEDVDAVQKAAHALFASENGLGPGAFPSLARMEREVVGFGLDLLNAPDGADGIMTSGGTDSITMAVKTARDYARTRKGALGNANIVLPRSAHPAFDKAALLMDIEIRRTPLKDYLADPAAIDAAADDETIMIVGSAPCFPYGLIDPIAELSTLACARGLWLHVDACVGGYMAPFVRMNGTDLPVFDFTAPGVRSISADLHKYGYCAKGASTLLLRDRALRDHMRFEVRDWPGGTMVTPTLAGTRPGGPIAAAWAVMRYLGVDGYRMKHREATDARAEIAKGAEALGFDIIGAPQLGIVAFTHASRDCGAILRGLYKRGWVTSATSEPKGLHLMLSPFHRTVTDAYLADLEAAMHEAAASDALPAAPRYGA